MWGAFPRWFGARALSIVAGSIALGAEATASVFCRRSPDHISQHRGGTFSP